MYNDCDHNHPPMPYRRDLTVQEFIERRYGLPPALPRIQDNKFVPVYPVHVAHGYCGDDLYIFIAKYIGEISNIYDLLLKIGTHQAIDPDHPLPYEFKIDNNVLYVRDKDNTKWTEIGDITKSLLGADEKLAAADKKFSKYVNDVTGDAGRITVKHGDGTTSSFPMGIDETYLHDITIENGYLKITRGNGSMQTIMLGIDVTYPKRIEFTDGKLVITQGNGTVVEIPMNYIANVADDQGTIKVTNSKNQSTNILTPITNEKIDEIFEGVWGEAARGL